jgi:hypothetical protein
MADEREPDRWWTCWAVPGSWPKARSPIVMDGGGVATVDGQEHVLAHVKLALVALVAGLLLWHMRRPQVHALDGAIFVGSLAIVWLGVSLAH